MNSYKVFISQPMSGLTDTEIDEIADRVISKFVNAYDIPAGSNFDIVNRLSFSSSTPKTVALGESIKHMEEADYIIFASGFTQTRGCLVEYSVVNNYADDWADDPNKPVVCFEIRDSIKRADDRITRHRCFMEDTIDNE